MRRSFPTAAILFACHAFAACGTQKEITVQRLDVQNALAPAFPVEKDAIVAKAQLTAPEVYFQNGGMGVKLHYAGRYNRRAAEGQIEFRGPLVYKPDKGAFYLDKIEVVNFTVNREQQSNKDKLQPIVEFFVTEFAADTPMYRLDQKEFAAKLSSLSVRSLHTWRGGMIVKFSN